MRLIKLFTVVLSIISTIYLTSSYAEPLGTTGKIQGKVIDSKSGTPLVGAIVKIEGTNMGASSDDAGDYVILNVPVGTYSIRCTYVGYEPVLQTEVRVSADITTKIEFSLLETVVKTDTLEIIAKRNVVAEDQSGKIITEESIVNTGIRGIENIAAKTAGVVEDERGTTINIRGGRSDETAVIIDGVLTTNPLDGNSTAYVSNNLLQEMAVLTGGFSAEYGNVMSGVINVTTKSGTSNYTGSAEVISDNIYSDILNTNTQQYNLYNINIGGPIIPTKKLKNFVTFYGGVERDYLGVAQPSWVTPELGLTDNLLPGYATKRWSGNGKLTFDFSNLNKKLNLKVIGGANISRTDDRLWAQSYMLWNAARMPQILTNNDQFYGKVTHQLNNKLFYEVQFNYFKTHQTQQDPILKDNLFAYGWPSDDPTQGVPGLATVGGRIPFDAYALFALTNRINNLYTNSITQYYEGSFNVTGQYKKNEIKFGGSYKYHTIRYYQVSPVLLATARDSSAAYQEKVVEGAQGLGNFYGYTWDGNSQDNSKAVDGDPSTFNGAKHPVVAALYLQDKIEFKDFTINAGLRFDYLNANTWTIKDLNHVVGYGDPSKLDAADFNATSQATYAFSPRLGFSFPVTDKSVFHAQYGRFIQLPPLQYLYTGYTYLSYWVNSAGFSGSFGNPNLKPERTNSYELGLKQDIGDRLSVDATVFYKETEDLIGINKYPQLPNQIQVYDNMNYGTIRGFDLAVELRRTSRLAMSIAYSLSYASGTGSDPNSASIASWLGTEQPRFTYPLDFDQRHTGTVNVDYRFGKNDVPKGTWGAILSRLGINLLYSFNSGRPYSKKDPSGDPFVSTGAGATLQSSINGEYGPWNHRLDLKIDKTVSVYKLDINFYIYVINVLNTELVNTVWPGSGDPSATGYLSTQAGMDYANSYNANPNTSAAEFTNEYTLRSKDIGNFGPPRQMRFGIRMNF
jgi:outer membrane receptor protein involved in Fe transport